MYIILVKCLLQKKNFKTRNLLDLRQVNYKKIQEYKGKKSKRVVESFSENEDFMEETEAEENEKQLIVSLTK